MSGTVVWFTGLPRSGKTTLAQHVRRALLARGRPVVMLDGDALRAALVPTPGYEPADRDNFYATLARIAALLAQQGLTVLVPATAHRRRYRDDARVLAPRLLEVHVATPLDECVGREHHGLYFSSAARPQLPGVGVAYEAPDQPDVIARGGHDELAAERLLALLAPN
jgi:adenylylsulfate kinase